MITKAIIFNCFTLAMNVLMYPMISYAPAGWLKLAALVLAMISLVAATASLLCLREYMKQKGHSE